MSEAFTGEIRMFAGNFAPRAWALCDGQLIAVSQNDALFSLLGTIYGGDGRTTFGLPDMRGRIPIHAGSGPGLSPRRLGTKSGSETETLTANQVPSHTHSAQGTTSQATSTQAASNLFAKAVDNTYRAKGEFSLTNLGRGTGKTGGNQPHNNLMPFQCLNFIIALYGVYPSRS